MISDCETWAFQRFDGLTWVLVPHGGAVRLLTLMSTLHYFALQFPDLRLGFFGECFYGGWRSIKTFAPSETIKYPRLPSLDTLSQVF
jgi:hypothetical protein